ncbi:MAG: hypothetical protein J5802_12115 [Butyrivibrio sp.]|nr:hypothetical protein [Butyrivibrio sp.]
MKGLKKGIDIAVLTTVMLILGGCGKPAESWAYNHEPTEEALALYDDGKAVFKGESYKYVKDDDSITLTDKDGNSVEHRYYMDKDTMVFYDESVYDYQGEGQPDGIVGTWKQDNGWVFTFTPEGEFSEEDIFYGHYSVDEENSSIKLMYSDPLEDTILYYSVDGNKLTVDYPWPMVVTQKDDAKNKSGSNGK